MNAFYGVPAIAGRGSKLSFWAAGAYSNNGLTTLLSSDATVRVIAYYNTKINSTNHTVCDYQDFSITAFSGWKEYTMDLDPNKNYYSIGFVCNKGGSYLPIDDITIYTVSPYTKYVPETYPEGTFKATASLAGKSIDIIFAIGNYDNQFIKVLASNSDAEATGISYNPSTKAITIPTTGSFDSVFGTFTYGTITGTYDSTNDKITKINCDGSIGSYLSNLTATHPTYYSPCDGSTSELQTQFKRRWNNGSWQVDTSNADRITKDDVHFVSGSGALKRRGYTGGAVALCFNSDFSSAISVQNVGFWVYNPSGSDITLRMWYYQAVNFGSNGETGSVTAKANGWSYCAMGFGTKTGGNISIYNFQIADFNNTGVYLTFDNIILF